MKDIACFILVIHFVGIPTVCVAAICQPGRCSLDDPAADSGMVKKCNIEADTSCSSVGYCNGNGQCYKPRGGSEYCNCSERTYGYQCELVDKSQYLYCSLAIGGWRCKNGGTCILNTFGKGVCHCKPGFRGVRCNLETRVMLLDSGKCQNGGSQYIQGHTKGCICPCGLTGEFCQTIARGVMWHASCNDKICNGNGICQINDSWAVYCKCHSGYAGQLCAIRHDSDICKCQHGGKCRTDRTDGQTFETYCRCPCGYWGPICENRRTILQCEDNYCYGCRLNYCENGGTCYINMTTCVKRCACTSGFYGDRCETEDGCRPRLNNGCSLVYCGEGKTCVEDKCGFPECTLVKTGWSKKCNKHLQVCIAVPLFTFVFLIITCVLIKYMCSGKGQSSDTFSEPHELCGDNANIALTSVMERNVELVSAQNSSSSSVDPETNVFVTDNANIALTSVMERNVELVSAQNSSSSNVGPETNVFVTDTSNALRSSAHEVPSYEEACSSPPPTYLEAVTKFMITFVRQKSSPM